MTKKSHCIVRQTGVVKANDRPGKTGGARIQPGWRFAASSVWGVMALVLWLTAASGHAQDSQPSESRLKAAFLFNFAKFVEWPPEAFTGKTAPLVIGVLGENSFGKDLEQTIQGKTVNDRPLQVKEYRAVAEATNCHILFICASEKKLLPEIFEALRGTAILTVGETDRFTQTGGMINFVVEGNKIRFEIKDETAKKAKLKISSKLLNLAVPATR